MDRIFDRYRPAIVVSNGRKVFILEPVSSTLVTINILA